MAVLKKSFAEADHRKSAAKKETIARKLAADPETERSPDRTNGKKGSKVQHGSLTRRGMLDVPRNP